MEIVALVPAMVIALLLVVCMLLVVFLLRHEKRFEKLESQVFKLELELVKLDKGRQHADALEELEARRRA